jgi:hypothetical protein
MRLSSLEVCEQFFAGEALLAHRTLKRQHPVFIALAELSVTVGSRRGVRLNVLFPK